jgi:type IV pilus assembly protein PilW
MRTGTERGLTLVELLVALAASSFVMLAVIGAVRAQQDGFRGGQRVREAQSSARDALLLLEQKLALAGFGMDPVLAFDLSGQPGDPDTTVFYAGPCPAPAAPCVKDRVDGSDELVFHARNPNYWIPPADPPPPPGATLRGRVWEIKSLAPLGPTVTLAARKGDFFPKGRILQGVCAAGAGARYFTVQQTTPPLAADGDVTLLLVDEVLTDPFKRQSAGACNPVRAFQIDRFRFHVRPEPVGDGTWEPFLVLDTGTDANGSGAIDAADEQILAAGIEVMQVSYLFELHAGGRLPEAGAQRGVAITVAPGAPNADVQGRRATAAVATAAPAASAIVRADFKSSAAADTEYYDQASLYPYRFGPPISPERRTNHQGNIRAVRVMLVGRSQTPAPETLAGWCPGTNSPVLNMNATPAWIAGHCAAHGVWNAADGGRDGYDRVRFETTVTLPSMVSRRLLFD